MTSLEDYKQRKSAVLQLLKKASCFFESTGDSNQEEILNDLYQSLEKGVFSITVVGEFSAGKSTFLNALMGEKYLPSFSSETTATINFLRSVQLSPTGKPLIVVHYKDGTSIQNEDVSLSTIQQYVSTVGDDVVHTVKQVDIYLDSPYLNDGVTLVDSPGLNGIAEGHAEVTEEQIKKSHAAIFMFCATQPGSKSNFEHLKRLINRCGSVIIVLNQIDRINEQSVEDVISNLKQNYQTKLGLDNCKLPEIWPIASLPALVARSKEDLEYEHRHGFTDQERKELLSSSKIKSFEDRLMRFLTCGEKTKAELLEPLHKLSFVLSEKKKQLEDNLAVLNSDVTEEHIASQIDAIQAEISKLSESVEAEYDGLYGAITNEIAKAKDSIKSGTRDIKLQYQRRLDELSEAEDCNKNVTSYINRLSLAYSDVYDNAIDDMKNGINEVVKQRLQTKAAELLSGIQHTISNNHIELQSLSIDSSALEFDVDLDQFYGEQQALEAAIDNLREQSDKEEIDGATALANERKKDELLRELSNVKQSYHEDLRSLGTRPTERQVEKFREKRKWGWSGVIRWIWNGNAPIQEKYYTYEAPGQEEYDSRKQEIEFKYDDDISEIKRKLESIKITDPSLYQARQRQLDRKIAAKEAELSRLEEKKTRLIEKNSRSFILHVKSYVQDCIESFDKSNREVILKYLDQMSNDIVTNAKQILETRLGGILAEKKEMLLQLQSQMTDSQLSKSEKTGKAKDQLEQIQGLLIEHLDIISSLENVETDDIKIQ